MQFFFSKLRDKLFTVIPDRVNRNAITTRLILSIYWYRCEEAFQQVVSNHYQNFKKGLSDEKRAAFMADENAQRQVLQEIISDVRPAYMPFNNPELFDPGKIDDGVYTFQSYLGFIKGFSEPFQPYFDNSDFIEFLEEADSCGSLKAVLGILSKHKFPSEGQKDVFGFGHFFWKFAYLVIKLRPLLLDMRNSGLSMTNQIFGLQQLFHAKGLTDGFEAFFLLVFNDPKFVAEQPDKQKRASIALEIAFDTLCFKKDYNNFKDLLESHDDELPAVLRQHLESFSGNAGQMIKRAGNGNFDALETLHECKILRSILTFLTEIDLARFKVESINLLLQTIIIENDDLFENSDIQIFFESLENKKTLHATGKVIVHTESESFYSYLLLHCHYDFKIDFSVLNPCAESLNDVKLKIKIKGRLGTEEVFSLGNLSPGQQIKAKQTIEIPGSYLSKLEEPEYIPIELQIVSNGEILHAVEHEVELFPFNQYFYQPLPETLVCFVTPNVNEIHEAVKVTKQILQEKKQNVSTEGYQSNDKSRILQLIEAVYETPARMGITYSDPPSSIAHKGQKVRFPAQVANEKKGTCLDMSVFFAALLRDIGLNPVIMVVEGHAYPGCYLTDVFYHACEKNLEIVVKSLKDQSLVVFDSSSAVTGVNFLAAVDKAIGFLSRFDFMIDVVAANKNKISPINVEGVELPPQASLPPGTITAPQLPDAPPPPPSSTLPVEAIEKFKGKLLNLSSRNPLLNHPYLCGGKELSAKYFKSKTAIYLACDCFDGFEAKFVDSGAASIECGFQNLEQIDLYLRQPAIGSSPVLKALLPGNVFSARCQEIRRKFNQEIAEKGSSSFVFGLGIIQYREKNKDFFAPLVLYSVTLTKDERSNKWCIVLVPDNVKVNQTLLFKLRLINPEHDFFGLFDSPEAEREGGVNWGWIFQKIRERLKDFSGFYLHEHAVLDFFPFSRFQLVQELDENREQLLNHELMKKFLELDRTSKEQSQVPLTNPPPVEQSDYGYKDISTKSTIKEPTDPNLFDENFMLVERADSTQQKVIQASISGESFILEGPPGTGKTTTITNIVAMNLLRGKSILFVAEKTTAMDQLAKGLEKCGLSLAFLKFPAAPTGKWLSTELFQKLDFEAPEITVGKVSGALKAWHAYRKDIFELTRALMQQSLLEKTAHEIISKIQNNDEFIEFDCQDFLNKDYSWFGDAKRAIKDYFDVKKSLAINESRLANFIRHDIVINPSELANQANAFGKILPQLEVCANLVSSYGLQEPVKIDHLKRLYNFFASNDAKILTPVHKKLVESEKTPSLFTKLRDWLSRSANQLKAEKSITQVLRPSILSLANFESLFQKFEEHHTSSYLTKLFVNNAARLSLKPYLLRSDMNDQDLFEKLAIVANYRVEQRSLMRLKVECETAFKQITGQMNLNWNNISKLMEEVEKTASSTERSGEAWLEAFDAAAEAEKNNLIDTIKSCIPIFVECYKNVTKILGFNLCQYFNVTQLFEIRIENLKFLISDLKALIPEISKVQALKKNSVCIEDLGLKDFLSKVAANKGLQDIDKVFENSFYKMWFRTYAGTNSAVSMFVKDLHDQKTKRFAEEDEILLKNAPKFISSRILNTIKEKTHKYAEKKTILALESRRTRRNMPIRKLLDKLEARYVTSLRPCFILSPMQVAEHIPLDYIFDMVIFDEASQVEPACAISSLRRAKQWLIVGDSKQMPPSQSSGIVSIDFDDEEADDSTAAEMESILDECTRCLRNIYWLSWHYRSKDERLISFSNQKFYDGKLVTFPGADDGSGNFGIVYKKVIGYCGSKVFNPGLKDGTNPVEAEFIVNYVIEKLRDADHQKRSYGLIASNDNQAELIRQLLNEKLSPTEKKLFLDESGTGLKQGPQGLYETLWVKPLEQVQGDERDVILLSTGFSALTEGFDKPESGRQISNLGKLMRIGAERRLNVALTRAREQLVVVTSMNSSDISDGCKNLGPRYLKDFLGYLEMESQKEAASHKPYSPPGKTQLESLPHLVRDITERLLAKGFHVENNLGYSSYKIEIAIKDSENPSRYLLAIETDGLTYQKAATSRDRDILRPAILRVFGWGNLYRVWLLEYIKSPEAEIEKIIAAIEAAKDRPVRAPMFSNQKMPENAEDLLEAEPGENQDEPSSHPTLRSAPTLTPTPTAPSFAFRPYEAYKQLQVLEKEIFEDEAKTAELCEVIYKVVQHESPLTLEILKKRIREIFKFGRLGSKLEGRLNKLLSSPQFCAKMRFDEQTQTIWDARSTYNGRFTPRQSSPERTLAQTPPDEVYAATLLVMENIIAAKAEDLESETCRAFLVQASENSRKLIRPAIEKLIREQKCYEDNGVIRIKTSLHA